MKRKLAEFFSTNVLPYIKSKPGLSFSLVFFVFLIIIYYWNFKMQNQLSDAAFVKTTIENANPRTQLGYISKMLKKEEFTLNLGIMTRSLDVVTHNASEQVNPLSLFEINNTFGLTGNDTVHYVFDHEWKKTVTHIITPTGHAGAYNNAPFDYGFAINYDQKNVYLQHDFGVNVEVWHPGSDEPELMKFPQFTNIAGSDGKTPVWYANGALATLTGKNDSLKIYYNTNEVPNTGGNSQSNPVTYAIQGKFKDVLLLNDRLCLHEYDKGQHSLWLVSPGTGMPYTPLIPVDVLNAVVKDTVLTLSAIDQDSYINYNVDGSLTVLRQRKEWAAKRFVIDSKDTGIDEKPFILGFTDKYLWLSANTNDNNIIYLKIDLKSISGSVNNLKPDTLQAYKIADYDVETSPTLLANVSDDGLTLVADSTLNRCVFYRCGNIDKNIQKIETASLLDTTLINNLADFTLMIPSQSKHFEMVAKTTRGIGVAYQVTPSKSGLAGLTDIKDNSADHATAVTWPSRIIFTTKSQIDYFFLVLLIIAVLVFYFFGLYYVMNIINGEPPIKDTWSFPEQEQLSFLYNKIKQIERTVRSLKLRSEIMLWLGLSVGVAGMIAFIFSLKIFFVDTTGLKFDAQFTVRMLRTVGIFAFMEVFSFYFLKQYRITFNEYKRFYSLFLRVTTYLEYFQLAKAFPDASGQTDIKEMKSTMLAYVVNLHEEGTTEKIKEFDQIMTSDVIKSLIAKIPG
ncbi:hypothetical protein [Mucilaginibacter psychrotolerans]|uniref:Uncharacterized protein n=1 Tax=Mucilaginibacter psychrotolerans TaxID=1524096 RepID=A0A4Y8SCM1_9SPHI|nr:hypothetical protein [Mucilaginibacter psychrotolerans]TFF36365.1 hypothetical protein E2R66_16145 [Mucilaginibacter psychrotolerans]